MTILLFILILVVLILVHEFGHFIAAKAFGVRVDEFGIGFPPRIFGKRWGETDYTINIFPIGGFVKIFGEDLETTENTPDFKRSFVAQNRFKQAIILIAGIIGNLLFAWLLFTVGFLIGMPLAVDETTTGNVSDKKVVVLQVLPESPAAASGLMAGDTLTSVTDLQNASATSSADAMTAFIREHKDKQLIISYERSGEEKTATATPKAGVSSPESTDAAIGVALGETGIITLPIHQALIEAGKLTWNISIMVIQGIYGLLSGLFTMSADLSSVSGPVGIAGLVGEASALGPAYLIAFTALISINLAIVNLIPFPALDGGRLLFVAIETVTRRRIPGKVAGIMNIVGFCLLIALMIAVTVGDITKLI